MTKIKFCGMMRAQDVALAGELGASHVGVIFAESPRRLTLQQAKEVLQSSGELKRVGVFGHAGQPLVDITLSAREAQLDVLQLHGNFSSDDIVRLRQDFDGDLWAVVPVDSETGDFAEGWERLADVVDALLVDTSVRGNTGGTGRPFDWELSAPVVRHAASLVPIILAGGLQPDNVRAAIDALHPAIVDVSSGVESSTGIKDAALMRAFADAVVSSSIV